MNRQTIIDDELVACHTEGDVLRNYPETFRKSPDAPTGNVNDQGASVSPKKPNGQSADGAEPDGSSKKLALPDAAWRGVFGEYRKAMREATEAADEFHFSTLLVRAGMTLGRRVWFNYGMKVYPNFYVLNFGPTGDKKTTAQRYLDGLGRMTVKVISGAGSGEALADEFQSVSAGEPCLICLEEFSELMRRGRWEGATVLPFLTTCFDCPPKYELRFRKSPVVIDEPTPNLIAGTTPEWFWQGFRLSDFQGGFGNRLLFFTGGRKNPIPLPSEPGLKLVSAAIDALASVPSGKARYTPEAEKLWRDFYRAWDPAQQKRDPMLRVAVERIPSYTLKIGMVYAGFEGTLPEITHAQLAAAILVGDFCAKCAEELLSLQNAGTNPAKELERRILAYVTQHPGTTQRQVYKALHRHYSDTERFWRSLRALLNAGMLLAESKGKGSYRLWTSEI